MANTIVLESFRTLRDADIPAVRWLWGNIIGQRSLTMVHASTKRGKSMLTMNLGLALACGAPSFLDIPVFGPGRVVIFQREIDRFWMQVRLKKMLANAPFPLTDEGLDRIVHNYSRAVRLHDMAVFKEFKALLRDIRPDYVVLDPLAHVLTENENDNAAVGRVMERILDIREIGPAVTIVHHNRKESEATKGADPMQAARGADRLIADSDTVISLGRGRRDPRGPVSRFVVNARNSEGSEAFSAVFNRSTCWWERTQERGDSELVGGWVKEAGSIARTHLIEMVEAQWKLSDPKHHRSAVRYIEKAVEAGVIEERGGVYVYARKDVK